MKTVQKRKGSRATDSTKNYRLEQLDTFLSSYKYSSNFDIDLKRFNLLQIKDRDEFITVRELFKIMCETKDGLFEEQLEFTTFTRFLERNGYSWSKPGNHIIFIGNQTTYHSEMALFYLFKLNPCYKIYRLKSSKNKDEDTVTTQECCLVVEFNNNSYISCISELIYDLYANKIRGITEGRGILRIYAHKIKSAKEIQAKLESLSKQEPTLVQKKE
nr:hypothetical protein [uncultured Cellulosilyticum sp.]